jgi:hypothetical protein
MTGALDEFKWRALADNLRAGQCTPFLGAGACVPTLPSGAELARSLAEEFGYPLPDREDLARVAQFIALKTGDTIFPKAEILKRLKERNYPDFSGDEPHHVLASLKQLPVYLTTNYDDFMVEALKGADRSTFRRDYCRWTSALAKEGDYIWQNDKAYRPTAAEPLVYHLHGCGMSPASLVVTEDDYLEFMYNIANTGSITKTVDRPWEMFPPPVLDSISGHALIFLGYRLSDWDFRIIFRWLVLSLGPTQKRVKIAVQLPAAERLPNLSALFNLGALAPVDEAGLTATSCMDLIRLVEQRKATHEQALNELWLRHAGLSGIVGQDPNGYLDKYFQDIFQVSVFWGSAQDFVRKLKTYLAPP